MAISSLGVGSGLDVNSIVSQLVAIEKLPLAALQTKATKFQTQLSLYGTLKSQASTLGDAAATLATSTGWNARKTTSSNTTAFTVTAGSAASPSSLSLEVSQLARAQSSASVGVAAGVAVGASGNLLIELGTWSGVSFTAASSVSVAIAAGDTVAAMVTKINAANAGVTASVLKDGANERLVLKSNSTGAAAGFRLNTPVVAGLAPLGLTNPSDGGSFVGQTAQNAVVKVNGISVESASNTLTDITPGVTVQLLQTTTTPATITVENDTDAIKKNIQAFVDAYNAVAKTLADATKYDATSKKGGPLQSDATTVGLQNALRAMSGSSSTGSTYTRLSEVGIERQADGSLKINSTKQTAAIANLDNLKALFTTDNSNTATNGFGLKVRDFARGLVASDGTVTNKTTGLQKSINNNSKDQDRVNERAVRVEAQLKRQYSELDRQMAAISGLSSYVTAQLAQWNKAT